jgi:hypothetical protein
MQILGGERGEEVGLWRHGEVSRGEEGRCFVLCRTSPNQVKLANV